MKWAIVEVMGHRRYAGQIREVSFAGASMLEVLVPAAEKTWEEREWYPSPGRRRQVVQRWPAYDVLLGGGSLFAVHACTENVARAAAPSSHHPDGIEGSVEYGEWVSNGPALPGPVEDAVEVARTHEFDELFTAVLARLEAGDDLAEVQAAIPDDARYRWACFGALAFHEGVSRDIAVDGMTHAEHSEWLRGWDLAAKSMRRLEQSEDAFHRADDEEE